MDRNKLFTVRPSWSEYFMTAAKLAALRSNDPSTKVGAVIVDSEHKMISMGYNGMPKGTEFTWEKNEGLNNKYLYVCHAEMNALFNTRNGSSVKDATIYVTLFPCNECAKMMVQAGIKKVVYLSDKYHSQVTFMASRKILEAAGIEIEEYNGRNFDVIINDND